MNQKALTPILFVILVVLLVGVFYFFKSTLQNTQLYKNAEIYYQDKVWVTFTSSRAKFSFKHPLSWPVTQEPDSELKQDMGSWIENIDFEEQWSRNAGGPRLGFIVVQETKYKSLKEYINKLSQEIVLDMYVKGTTQKATIYPPKISYLNIGGVEGISVTDINSFATLTARETADYQLIRNGLLYRFVTKNSDRFLENKEKNSKTFQQIIASIKFLD